MAFDLLWAKKKKKPFECIVSFRNDTPHTLVYNDLKKKPSKPWCGPFVSIDQLK